MSIATISDFIGVLRDILRNDSGFAALVTGGDVGGDRPTVIRVYNEALPPNPIVSASIPGVLPPTIVLRSLPSGAHLYLPMASALVQLRAYATGFAAARDLWYAAYRVLVLTPKLSGSVAVETLPAATLPTAGPEYGTDRPLATGIIPVQVLAH